MSGARAQMILIIGGVLVLVFGLILADVVIDSTVVAVTNAAIGSFPGASAVGGLIPFIYFAVIILVAVGLMGIGAKGLAGSMVAGLPLVLSMFTPVPASIALTGVLLVAAIYSYRQYREIRRSREFAQVA